MESAARLKELFRQLREIRAGTRAMYDYLAHIARPIREPTARETAHGTFDRTMEIMERAYEVDPQETVEMHDRIQANDLRVIGLTAELKKLVREQCE